MKFLKIFISIMVLIPGLCHLEPGTSYAEENLTAKEIMTRSDNLYVGKDMASGFEVRLINASGEVRRRELLRYRKEFDGRQKDLLKYNYPLDIKDVTTLTEEVKDKEDTQYLYLPAAKKLRRVSGKGDSWMGTDWTYEDLQEFEIDQWDYELLGSEEIDGFDCYVLSLTPREGNDTNYSKRTIWIRKKDYYQTKWAFYDKRGELLKTSIQTDVHDFNGALYAKYMKVHNVQDNHRTEFERQWCLVDTDMPADFFTTRYMEKSIELYDFPPDLHRMWDAARKKGS